MYLSACTVPLTAVHDFTNCGHPTNAQFQNVYNLFRENWGITSKESGFLFTKAARAIFLDQNNIAFGICEVPLSKSKLPLASEDHPLHIFKPVFEKAKQLNSSTIMFAQNHIDANVRFDNTSLLLIDQYFEHAEEVGIKVLDFFTLAEKKMRSSKWLAFREFT